MSVKVLLVDDHRMFRDGLRLLIARELPDASVVGEAATASAALAQAKDLSPDIVVMDIHLPDGNGIEASREILAEVPAARVIILSGEPDLAFIREALRAGVSGYLLKSAAPTELTRAIHAVLQGTLYLCEEVGKVAMEDYKTALTAAGAAPKPALSVRELEVLRLIGDGLRTKEIADKLGISIKTAETYRQRLIAKVGCNGTAELVRYAVREGLLSP